MTHAADMRLRVMRRSPSLSVAILGALVVAGASPLPSTGVIPSAAPTDAWSGLSWSAPTAGPDGFVRTVLQVAGSFVAVGTHSGPGEAVAAWRSVDGRTWQHVAIEGRPDVDSNVGWLVPIPGALLAVGTSEKSCMVEGEGATCPPGRVVFWMSADGSTWLRVPTPAVFNVPDLEISSLAAGPGGLLAIGDAGFHRPRIWRSMDGVDWERVALPHDAFAGADLWDATWTPQGWLVVGSKGGTRHAPGGIREPNGSRGAAWISPQGRIWDAAHVAGARSGPEVILRELYPGAHGVLALGTPEGGQVGKVWASHDGRDWSTVPTPGADVSPVFPIAADGERIIGQAPAADGHVALYVSTGGADWQPLDAEGATTSLPMWSGGPELATLDQVFLLPDGLLAFGDQDGESLVWRVTAVH